MGFGVDLVKPNRPLRERLPLRRLTAILAADVAGYARLMGADESDTLRRLRAIQDVQTARVGDALDGSTL